MAEQRREATEKSQRVDPSGLSRAFPQHFKNAAHSITIEKLAGDASSRIYYRLKAARSDGKSGEKTFVLQASEFFSEKSALAHPFLEAQKLLEHIAIPVPKVLGLSPEDGWILLEDLGDETLQHHPLLDLYKRSVELIVDWTTRAVKGSALLGPNFESALPFSWAFDFEKLQAEMIFTDAHLVRGILKDQNFDYLAAVEANSRFLAERPRFFCHRDFHSRNIMVSQGQVFVIDFQDARMGPLSYDLVSLLWDPYVRLSEPWRAELLKLWFDHLQSQAKNLGIKQIEDVLAFSAQPGWMVELERMKIQRLLKAAGSYASFFIKKGRRDYLPAIRPALLDTASGLEELKKLGHFHGADAELLTWIHGQLENLDDIIERL